MVVHDSLDELVYRVQVHDNCYEQVHGTPGVEVNRVHGTLDVEVHMEMVHDRFHELVRKVVNMVQVHDRFDEQVHDTLELVHDMGEEEESRNPGEQVDNHHQQQMIQVHSDWVWVDTEEMNQQPEDK